MDDHPEQCAGEAMVVFSGVFANRPRAALEAYDRFCADPVMPDTMPKVTALLAADAYHLVGEHEKELDLLRDLSANEEAFQGILWVREAEAGALAALGRIDECRQVLATALTEPAHWPTRYGELLVEVAAELHAHGHETASLEAAQQAIDWFDSNEFPPNFSARIKRYSLSALSLARLHEEAMQLATSMLDEYPDWWGVRAVLGVSAARTGDRPRALDASRQLAAVDEPFLFGGTSIGRAAIAAQLGERDEAIRLLRQAVNEGFWDWRGLHADPYFEPLWDDPEFQEILRPKG
jgi:tetratricopeptide (TPR) repeat protein